MREFYKELIAGSAPSTEQDYVDTAYYETSRLLDTDAVHAAFEYSNGRVYYIAVPGTVVIDNIAETQLVSALKHSTGHKGNGVYVLTLKDGSCVALVRKANSLEKRFGSNIEDIMKSVDLSLQVFDVNSSPKGLLEGFRGYQKRVASQMFGVISRYAYIAAGIFAFVSLSALSLAAYSEGEKTTKLGNIEKSVSKIVSKLNEKSDIYAQMNDIRILTSVTARSGGWIKQYHMKNGNVYFSVEMPDWVTRDYISPLGDVTAERNLETGSVVFTKGTLNNVK